MGYSYDEIKKMTPTYANNLLSNEIKKQRWFYITHIKKFLFFFFRVSGLNDTFFKDPGFVTFGADLLDLVLLVFRILFTVWVSEPI
jgi:hypothetical protein